MNKYPAIKTVCFFVLGIILQFFLQIDKYLLGIILLLLFFITGYVVFYKRGSIKNEALFLFILISLLIISGAFRFSLIRNESVMEISRPMKSQKIIAEVNSIDFSRDDGFEFIAKIDSILIDSNYFNIDKNFLFKVQKSKLKQISNLLNDLSIGDKVYAAGIIQSAREKRNPGEFDYKKYLTAKGISGIVSISKIKIEKSDKINFLNIILFIRKSIDNKISLLFEQKSSALIKGLLLANRKNIDYESMEYFINSGVVHILAVSGLHVGFVILIFLFIFSRANIILKYLFTFIGLLIFICLTDFQASVIRASIMAFVVLSSNLMSRKSNGINSISIAALLILIIEPTELFNPGFQLSFVAVLGILVLYPPLSNWLSNYKIARIIKNILLFILVSLSATIATIPFTIYYFHKLSLISLLANLFVIPLTGLIVALGIAAVSFSYFWLLPAKLLANTTMLLIEIMFYIVEYFGKQSFSFIQISDFSNFDFLVYYFFLTILFVFFTKSHSIKAKFIVMILVIMNFLVWNKLDNKPFFSPNYLSVLMIDVGQGDAFLVKLPDEKLLLIDAGANQNDFDNGEKIISPLLKYLNITKIDYGMISHIDNDHSGGFNYLINNYSFKNIYKPIRSADNYIEAKLESNIELKKINLIHYRKSLIRGNNYRIYILNNNDSLTAGKSENDKSGIIKIQNGNISLLFVGDAGFAIEEKLIKQYDDFLDSDILKLGHHGSKYSSSEEFIKITSPKYALISVGMSNRFGHPAKKVIDLLNKEKVKIFRTDYDKAILLETDGNKIFKKDWN